MEQKDKELLLKDLCARLPYGIKVQVEYNAEEFGKTIETDEITMIDKYGKEILLYHAGEYFSIEELKPYLRPMSSMTEEEKKEFCKIEGRIAQYFPCKYIKLIFSVDELDWLNKKMFDYRKDDEDKTMIKKGLALKAPEGMYEFE